VRPANQTAVIEAIGKLRPVEPPPIPLVAFVIFNCPDGNSRRLGSTLARISLQGLVKSDFIGRGGLRDWNYG
jgi:hypothetical protein